MPWNLLLANAKNCLFWFSKLFPLLELVGIFVPEGLGHGESESIISLLFLVCYEFLKVGIIVSRRRDKIIPTLG